MAYVDDLYRMFITHWVHDDAVFADERQRVQLPTAALMASFLGCRPVSLFDTRVKFQNSDYLDYGNYDKVVSKSNSPMKESDSDQDTLVDSDSDSEHEMNLSDDTAMETDSKVDGHGDGNGEGDSGTDSGTDDGYDAGSEETRSILYRHIRVIVVRNPTAGKPNIVLMKVTLLHTKGEDNKPRM